MKRLFLIILSTIFPPLMIYSQSTQSGFIKEYNDSKEKKPMVGVEILVSNANRDVTGKKGEFHLTFRTLKPGDPIKVQNILKEGYEIFNKEQLDVWRVSNNGEPFTIVLCNSSKFKALKDQYNAISYKSYNEQMERELKALDELVKSGKLQQEQYEKQKRELCQFYDNKLDNLDTYIDRFARIDLSEVTRDEQRIVELVRTGHIQDAVDAYNALKLDEKLISNYLDYQKADSAILKLTKVSNEKHATEDELLSSLNNKFDLMMMRGGYDVVDSILSEYERIAEQCPNSYKIIHGLVDFAYKENHCGIVAKWGRVLLDLPITPLMKADCCMKLAYAEDLFDNQELADLYKTRSSEWLEIAMKEDPLRAIPVFLSKINRLMVDRLLRENEMDEFLQETPTYLAMLDSISAQYPTEDVEYLIQKGKYNTYKTLAQSALMLMDVNTALHYESLAISCVDSMLKNNNDEVLCLQAEAYNGYGLVNVFAQNYECAEEYLVKAYNILMSKFRNDPFKNYFVLLNNFVAIGNCYYYKGDIEKSLEVFTEAMECYECIIEGRPYPMFYAGYAEVINNLGYLSFLKGDYDTAEKTYLKAIERARPFAQKNEFRFLSSLCIPQINLGMLKLQQGKLDEFATIQDEYWNNMEKVYGWHGIPVLNNYCVAWDNRGYYELLRGNEIDALKAWDNILKLNPEYPDLYPASLLLQALKERGL